MRFDTRLYNEKPRPARQIEERERERGMDWCKVSEVEIVQSERAICEML